MVTRRGTNCVSRAVALAVIFAAVGHIALANDAAKLEHFEKKIRPVLVAQCYSCHSAEAAKGGKLKGDLQLDTRAALLAGGESGPAIVPGKPAESPLLAALKFEDLEMPPDGKLSDAVIADFEKWITDGAVDPRTGDAVASKKAINFDEARQFWSFRPVAKHPAPAVKDSAWAKGDIDRFVLAKLEAAGLSPTADASDEVLVRRLYFDLIGLPPQPEEVAAFVTEAKADREAAIARLVDKLLASQHFGERWGRHWLDVVRYAESNGRDQNIVWHHAWRYRQYVIDALNQDKPFDRFAREQIAGDLLPLSGAERDAAITATGMLAMSPKNIEETNKALYRMDLIDDQIEVTTRAFLALSVSCARCHDHKFDPIPTKDYYALAGIFGSSDTLYGPARWGTRGTPHKHYAYVGADGDSLGPPAMKHVQQLEQAHLDFTQARVDRYGIVRKVADLKNQLAKPDADKAKLDPEIARMEAEILVWDEKIKELGQQLEDKIANPPPQPQWVMALRDLPEAKDCAIHIRGETSNLGDVTPRGVLQLFALPDLPAIDAKESGRRQLAEWIAHPQNPLTPRVAVNRVWLHLFGKGIVATMDDFGTVGAAPSHPELLDHLAVRFVEEGWSIKKLIKTLVMTRTYQQASTFDRAKFDKDPDNVLLWRASPRRIEVEVFRDSVLAVAGKLNLSPPSQPLLAKFNPYKQHTWASHDAFIKPADLEWQHRTVYLPVIRGVLPELFTLFDFADPSRVVGERGDSVVPAQALFLMNSPWMLDRSREAAERLLATPDTEDSVRLNVLFERALNRPPTDAEAQRLLEYVNAPATGEPAQARLQTWSRVCQIVFSSAEFRTLR